VSFGPGCYESHSLLSVLRGPSTSIDGNLCPSTSVPEPGPGTRRSSRSSRSFDVLRCPSTRFVIIPFPSASGTPRRLPRLGLDAVPPGRARKPATMRGSDGQTVVPPVARTRRLSQPIGPPRCRPCGAGEGSSAFRMRTESEGRVDVCAGVLAIKGSVGRGRWSQPCW
jgi:hypothetical protein